LHGRIPNVQVSWVKMGMDASGLLLQGGANDFGGTLMEGDDQSDGGGRMGDQEGTGRS